MKIKFEPTQTISTNDRQPCIKLIWRLCSMNIKQIGALVRGETITSEWAEVREDLEPEQVILYRRQLDMYGIESWLEITQWSAYEKELEEMIFRAKLADHDEVYNTLSYYLRLAQNQKNINKSS